MELNKKEIIKNYGYIKCVVDGYKKEINTFLIKDLFSLNNKYLMPLEYFKLIRKSNSILLYCILTNERILEYDLDLNITYIYNLEERINNIKDSTKKKISLFNISNVSYNIKIKENEEKLNRLKEELKEKNSYNQKFNTANSIKRFFMNKKDVEGCIVLIEFLEKEIKMLKDSVKLNTLHKNDLEHVNKELLNRKFIINKLNDFNTYLKNEYGVRWSIQEGGNFKDGSN